MVYHATARGIEIRSVESELEGDLDLRGFLGIAPEMRKGYSEIRVKMRVEVRRFGRSAARIGAVFAGVRRRLAGAACQGRGRRRGG